MSKKKIIEDYHQLAKIKDGLFLDKNVPQNTHTKGAWQCQFGHIWEAEYNSINGGNWCKKCFRKSQIKHKIEDCHSLAVVHDGECLSSEYVNSQTDLVWRCKFGHIWRAPYNRIDHGTWCKNCADDIKEIEDYKNLAFLNEISFLDKNVPQNTHTKCNWKCKQGHTWPATYNKIRQGRKCPKCKNKSQTKLFEIVKLIFPGYECFFSCKPFDWLKNIFKLEIDIWIPELHLAIEYDGRQHFECIDGFGGPEEFEKIKTRDKLKNEIIKDHHEDVKYFIRIPYWEELTKKNIKRILIKNKVKVKP